MRFRTVLSATLLIAVFTSVILVPYAPAQANPQVDWKPTETDLSGWQTDIYDYHLVMGQDGTLGAIWTVKSTLKWSL
jgi:hypothetical protein